MTGEPTASRRVRSAALLSALLFALASPAAAGPEALREGLFRKPNGAGPVAAPSVARYVSEEGRVFILDRTQPRPLLKFDDDPEVWVLAPQPAPRGDVIYKNDMGEPMLRATRLGGFTLFTDQRPAGEAVSLAGGAGPLRLVVLSPQGLGERMLQASVRSGRAARRTVIFEAEATPASATLIADSALVVSLAFLRLSSRDGGRSALARVGKVQFLEGRRPAASFAAGTLRIVVTPAQGLAGRPSSGRIAKVLRSAK
jgi:hypothetical protein